jgi:hypothetical protein
MGLTVRHARQLFLVLFLAFLLPAKSVPLRALLTTAPEFTELLYCNVDSASGRIQVLADWSRFGASTGGHAWSAGPNGATAVATLFLNETDNWVYLFDATGQPAANFSSPLVFDTIEYSPASAGFVTSTIIKEAMNTAQLSWTAPNVIPRVSFNPDFYQQELGVSAMDPVNSVLYMYGASDTSQNVYLFAVSTSSFTILRQVPSAITPLALEYFDGTLLAVVQGEMALEVSDASNCNDASNLKSFLQVSMTTLGRFGSRLIASTLRRAWPRCTVLCPPAGHRLFLLQLLTAKETFTWALATHKSRPPFGALQQLPKTGRSSFRSPSSGPFSPFYNNRFILGARARTCLARLRAAGEVAPAISTSAQHWYFTFAPRGKEALPLSRHIATLRACPRFSAVRSETKQAQGLSISISRFATCRHRIKGRRSPFSGASLNLSIQPNQKCDVSPAKRV